MAKVWYGWVRVVLGTLVAAAMATAPVWWEAAGAVAAAGPLAWRWLVPAVFAAMVMAITLLAPPFVYRRRPGRRMDRFEAVPPAALGVRAPVGTDATGPPHPQAGGEPEAAADTADTADTEESTAVREPARPEPPHRRQEPAAEPEPAAAGGAPVTVYEADAFAKEVQQARESVALEGGVYRVREQLSGARGERRRSLRRIAESVITDDKITHLETAGRRREVRTPVTGDGVSYDRLAAQFPDPESSETRMRVLEEQRAALRADAAVLLVSRAAGYTAELVAAAAALPRSPLAALSTMTLGTGDALYDDCLAARCYLLAEPGSGVAPSLPCAADRVALLPATLDGRRAYLLFVALARRDPAADEGVPWTSETLIERLNLHP